VKIFLELQQYVQYHIIIIETLRFLSPGIGDIGYPVNDL